jgi:hypothetical protein
MKRLKILLSCLLTLLLSLLTITIISCQESISDVKTERIPIKKTLPVHQFSGNYELENFVELLTQVIIKSIFISPYRR